MKNLYLSLAMVFAMLQIIACGDSDGVSSNSNDFSNSIDFDESHPGMEKIRAVNSSVLLGSNEVTAKANERPQMKVVFTYDFWFSKNEVTCGEFNSLMKSTTGLSLKCEQESLPATDITYYDAVLFANARSKAEKFDTVYTYNNASFDNDKHCTNLDGFAFHPEKKGYRMPTEAEWMLVAQSYWNPSEGWTSENSDYKLHKVCSKNKSDAAICDMVGNAMEWVNDWLGNFRDTTLTDYVGAPDGGSLGHRVVKGGSYRSSSESINKYNRGDVYTVTSSTRADYVGFRLAYGNISGATWMGADGKAATSRIVALANSSKMRSETGTYKVKLAFRNDVTGNVAFVDYSSGILSVTEISDKIDSYHPEISPDGKKVAFSTGFEGINSDTSTIYVRDLNADGSNLVKLEVKGAAIPRWRVLDNGDTVIVYVSNPGNNKEEASFKSTSTWQVKFANGKFGKPEKLFDGAYHGGISEDNKLAVSGARLLRARIAKSGSTIAKSAIDTVWYKNEGNAEQACNASLAKDGSKRTLFLDFGGKTGREFVGKNYGTHERLLIADSTGKLVQSVASPKGYSFDHSEWSMGGKNLAVATLANVNGAHLKIVLVNLSDSSIVELAEGDELWHPNLWIQKTSAISGNSKLDPDSACAYMTETSDITTRLMKVKMDYFWKYKDTTEIAIIGSSRSFAGMDPEYIKSGFALNMAYSAQDLESTTFFTKNYILPMMPKLKVLALTLDYDRWYVKDENFKAWFGNIPGYEYDKNHGYWHDGLVGDMVAASQAALNPTDAEYEQFGYHRGLYYDKAQGWGAPNPEIANDSNWFKIDQSGFDFNLQKLTEILKMARNHDVFVVGVVYPQSRNFLKTNAWGRYGPTRGAAKIMQDAVLELTKTYPNFAVLDEYHDGNHDFAPEAFANEDHLGLIGAQIMASRLDSLLNATLK
ncbi:MAG: TIGR02171 family protein [Fibrobacter sp.]|uniref:TIGR02171 family lipoprotein n=1 Tax=Fibrobacter sp. TaxID=35828 RepID=UPI0025BE2F29|nr:TIGR02171 family protein [Fibrobacter sp.]MBQ7079241.1 TIGR02171 family protein [Fibrobacter sp.]